MTSCTVFNYLKGIDFCWSTFIYGSLISSHYFTVTKEKVIFERPASLVWTQCWKFPELSPYYCFNSNKNSYPYSSGSIQNSYIYYYYYYYYAKLLRNWGNRKDYQQFSHCCSIAIRKWLFTHCIHEWKPRFRQEI